jgi:hypothetical protein
MWIVDASSITIIYGIVFLSLKNLNAKNSIVAARVWRIKFKEE